MKKIALTAGAVLALSLGMAPVALAQDDDSCDSARKALVQAETRLENRAAQERVEELAELDAAKIARNAAQVARDTAQKAVDDADPVTDELRKALKDAKAELEAAKDRVKRAQDALDSDSRRLADLRASVTVAIQERDEACDDDVTTTPPTATPTTTPAPTTVVVPDVNIDNDVDVVVPRGGVNTGGWRK